ncbi:MAG: fibronectin type III domain-containing protein [Clostridiales bacterium]|jgi:hypothetical protein|nr:fibronectin type III domain-containing protein [Clostridiales bacterium]
MKKLSKIMGFILALSLVTASIGNSAMAGESSWAFSHLDPSYARYFPPEDPYVTELGEDLREFPLLPIFAPGHIVIDLKDNFSLDELTPEMFPGIDIENIEYFYEPHSRFELTIKDKTEEAVLNAIAVLMHNPLVKKAPDMYIELALFCPITLGELHITLTQRFSSLDELTPEMFPGVDIKAFHNYNNMDDSGFDVVTIKLKEQSAIAIWQAHAILQTNPLVKLVLPVYNASRAFYVGMAAADYKPAVLPTIPAVKIADKSTDSITLEWEDIPEATSYQIYYNGQAVTAYEPNVTLTGLSPDAEYKIKVMARKGNAISEWSDEVVTVTDSAQPPTALVVSSNFSASLVELLSKALKAILAALSLNSQAQRNVGIINLQ